MTNYYKENLEYLSAIFPMAIVLDTNQVKSLLGCSEETVYQLVRDHKLKSIKVGKNNKYPVTEIAKFISK